MIRVLAAATLVFFCGATLLLSELHWFRRRPLLERISPYCLGAGYRRPRSATGGQGLSSWRDAIAPLARLYGDRLARLFGVSEPLAVRLERVHATVDVAEFRLRQMSWVGAGLAGGTLLAVVLQLSGPLAAGFVLGAPLLAFLLYEQRLANASRRWQRRLFRELPVVAEQLGMLLGAGYSLGAAINRLAERGRGACGQDLQRVAGRIRVGLSEVDALREWAAVANVVALDRLVGVLALNRQAGDLGRLISDEARSIRRDMHRELIEVIERRAQQVWVPVTLATLVPGAIFLAVPFVEALRLFSST